MEGRAITGGGYEVGEYDMSSEKGSMGIREEKMRVEGGR